MSKWQGLAGPITAEAAEAEPERDRLFGPSDDACVTRRSGHAAGAPIDRATYRPWKKPRIERQTKR